MSQILCLCSPIPQRPPASTEGPLGPGAKPRAAPGAPLRRATLVLLLDLWPPARGPGLLPLRDASFLIKALLFLIMIILLGVLVPLIPAPVLPGKWDGSVQGGVKQAFSSLLLKSRRECGLEGGCHRVEARPAAARTWLGLGGGLWASRSPRILEAVQCPRTPRAFWDMPLPRKCRSFFFSFYYST